MNLHTIEAFGMKLTASERGAQLTSWQDAAGREHIWRGDPAVWANQAPILFPVCGATKDLTIGGQPVTMAKHGFVKTAPWTLTARTSDALTFTITDNAESRACYPFAFALQETLRLIPQGFTCTYTVENRGDKPLPYCIGAHPGFVCPMEDGASFADYDVVFDAPESGAVCTLAPGGLISGEHDMIALAGGRVLPLHHRWFDERDTLLFDRLNSRGVSLICRGSGHGLRMDFADFPALALWSMVGANADYLCIEPWIGLPQAGGSCRMEDKPGLQILAPGEARSCAFTVTLI